TVNDQIKTITECPVPTSQALKTTYSNYFNNVVTMWWENNHVLQVGEMKTMLNGTFIEPEALNMFSFKMKVGTPKSLQDETSIVLSESAAKALFGDEDPINQSVRIDNMIDVKVAGIFEQMPNNSRFNNIQFLGNWDMWVASNPWLQADNHNWEKTITTFVELKPGVSFDEVNAAIADLKKSNISEGQSKAENPELFLEPMSRWHLY